MRGIVENVGSQARHVDALALQLRDAAGDVAAADRVEWRSLAADRWRAELLTLASDLRHEAERLQDAAGELRAHERAAHDTLDAIERARSRFFDGLDWARDVLSAAADEVTDAAVDAARRTVDAARRAPPTWSLDWLGF